jgi:hypothetical protein
VPAVAILERVEPFGSRWAPTVTAPEEYGGRHRSAGRRRFSLLAMFYVAAHVHYVARHARSPVTRVRYVPRHGRLG